MQKILDGRTIDDLAIESLQLFAPKDGSPFYFAYSGGKDSTVVLDLLQRSGVAFESHNQWIPLEPPELRDFVAQMARRISIRITRPRKPLIRIALEGKRCLMPLRNRRWCCQALKEDDATTGIVVTGIRAQESSRRRRRQMVEHCYRVSARAFLHPIIQWSTGDVWDYIRERSLPYCPLYDEGFARLGCVLCPMTRDVDRQMARWPGITRIWRRIADAIWEKQQRSGRCPFPTADAHWEWWLDRDRGAPRNEEETCPLFPAMLDADDVAE